MDAHALEKLEFQRIGELLSTYASGELGRELARRISPVTSRAQIATWLGQVRELLDVREHAGMPPFGGIRDVRPQVRSAVPPAKLEPEDLADIAETLSGTHLIRQWAEALPPSAERLVHLVERVGDFAAVAEQIGDAVDARGSILDDATPRLGRIRREIDAAQRSIGVVVSRLLRSQSVKRMLQYANSTFHNDRVVLPLKAEYRGRIEGIIHRSSDSGSTLFVEPAAAVEQNNAIIRLRRDEHEEITRILWKLTQLIHLNRDSILETLNALAVLDLVTAKVRMADHLGLHCAELVDEQKVRLRAARHPLLLMRNRDETPPSDGPPDRPEPDFDGVVPIDVRLGEDFDLLIVTGPNTGGKTVTLKTIGLLAAMHQAGLPIPAQPGSRLPVFDNILIDLGDEQSLQQSLSTFSAHLKHVLMTLRRSTPNTLVMIDELGAGTDPEEGAAIGRAVLDELLRIGCRMVVTTHLGALKSVAFDHPRVENASVEFDVETLRPTYHLRIGEAGSSNALAIARKLGMPERVIEAAEGHLSGRHKDLSRMLKGTAELRRRAEDAYQKAETKAMEADQAREQFQRQTEELRAKQIEFETWRRWVTTLKPGDKVHVKSFDRSGTLVRLQLQRQQAVVAIGSIEVEVALADVVPEGPE